jgi:hypothetical protein
VALKRTCLRCGRLVRGVCGPCATNRERAKTAKRPERKRNAAIISNRELVADHRATVGDWCPGLPGDATRPAHLSADLVADHVREVALGGREDGVRVVRCRSCNSTRSANIIRQAGLSHERPVPAPVPAPVAITLRRRPVKAGPKAAVDSSRLPFRSRHRGGERFAAFCREYVVVPKGHGALRRLRPRPWQVDLVSSVWGADPKAAAGRMDAPPRPGQNQPGRRAGHLRPAARG